MENDPVTVEPVERLDRQRDISSSHEEIQVSRTRKAQDTLQFQSTDTNHDNYDLEKSLQNLGVVEGEGATGGYSACSVVQPEESDDLPGMLTDQVFSNGMFNTCTIDTILSVMTILQLETGPIHDFFKNSKHLIYRLNSHLPQLVREGRLSEMRSYIAFYKGSEKDYADDINNLLERRYVIHQDSFAYCAKCRSKRWTVVVNFKDFRPENEDDVPNCIPDEMLKNPPKFFNEILQDYLRNFYLHNTSDNGIVAYCTNCKCKRKITYEVEGSDGNPAPLFIVMLPINGTTVSGNVIWEDLVKDISPLFCLNYEYVLGAVMVFVENPNGSETSSNCSDSQEEQRPGIIADADEEPLGHYIGHVYIVNPESGEITKKYRYCNSKGNKKVNKFEEEGHCVTFLFFRTK